jgi:AcrR family transcriptional regulator
MAQRGRPRKFDRAAALQRAMEVFWSKGYELTSLSDLTEAMGINTPSLYAAFQSKEALFLEAVELYAGKNGAVIWGRLEEAPTARDAFEQFLLASAQAFTRPEVPAGCLIVLGAMHASDMNEKACTDLRHRRAQNVETLSRRLQRAVAEGELPADLDCQAVASFYVSVQYGMSIQARDGASRETLIAVARQAMTAWLA